MDLQMNIYWSFRSGGFEPQIRDIVMLGLPGGCVNPAQTRRDYITGLVYSCTFSLQPIQFYTTVETCLKPWHVANWIRDCKTQGWFRLVDRTSSAKFELPAIYSRNIEFQPAARRETNIEAKAAGFETMPSKPFQHLPTVHRVQSCLVSGANPTWLISGEDMGVFFHIKHATVYCYNLLYAII